MSEIIRVLKSEYDLLMKTLAEAKSRVDEFVDKSKEIKESLLTTQAENADLKAKVDAAWAETRKYAREAGELAAQNAALGRERAGMLSLIKELEQSTREGSDCSEPKLHRFIKEFLENSTPSDQSSKMTGEKTA